MSQNLASFQPADAVIVAADEALNPYVRKGVAYWRSLQGERRFPARADLTLRGMAPILPYAVIASVIDGGSDFEFRYVGEEQRQAFRTSFKGFRVTQIEAVAPALGRVLRTVYERARALGEPFIVRGRVDYEPQDSNMRYHETAFLPLGVSDAAVDHLLMVGVQIPEPFWDIKKDDLTVLADKARAGAPKPASAPDR